MSLRGVRVVEVIEAIDLRGEGVDGDPVREVIGYYNLSGDLLAERDTWARSERR